MNNLPWQFLPSKSSNLQKFSTFHNEAQGSNCYSPAFYDIQTILKESCFSNNLLGLGAMWPPNLGTFGILEKKWPYCLLQNVSQNYFLNPLTTALGNGNVRHAWVIFQRVVQVYGMYNEPHHWHDYIQNAACISHVLCCSSFTISPLYVLFPSAVKTKLHVYKLTNK